MLNRSPGPGEEAGAEPMRAGFVVGLPKGRVGLLSVDAVRPGRRQPRTAEVIHVPNVVQPTRVVYRAHPAR